ncbi:MAG TPA: nucleotidyltransferase family protein [Terriglobales bacterium]
MPQTAGICGVILAAGESTRMGRDKALLPWPPVAEGAPAVNTFLGAMIDLLQQHADLVIVVAGRNIAELEPVVDAHGAFTVVNPAPERGQFSSIQVGLRNVLNRGRDAAFLVPVDRPPVLPATVRDLRAAFLAADTDVWAVVPEVLQDGAPVHGHPILVGREMMEQFLRAPATAVARDIQHQHHQHIRYLRSQDARVSANIDTPEDYRHLLRAEVVPADTAS